MSPRTIHNVWADWFEHRRPEDRTILLAHYAGIPKYIAARIDSTNPVRTVEVGDLIAYGVIGLAAAIDRYKPTENATFETYAHPRVKGAILDGLRAENPVARNTQDMVTQIRSALETFREQGVCSPSPAQLADETGISKAVVTDLLANLDVFTTPIHLDGVVRDDRTSTCTPVSELLASTDGIPDDQSGLAQDMGLSSEAIAQAVSHLAPLHRAVVALVYLDELTISQVAEACGRSERHVRRVHEAALGALRDLVPDLGSNLEQAV